MNMPYMSDLQKTPQWNFNPRSIIYILLAIGILIMLLVKVCRAEEINLTASWYSIDSLKKEGTYKHTKGVMANGDKFIDTNYTGASRDFPLGAIIKVTNTYTGKNVTIKITDKISKRFQGKRIDLSKRAFSEIADCKQGIIQVEVKRIK